MHRNVGLDQAHDALRVATLQSGFRGFAIQEVRSVPLPAEGTSAERLQAALAALELSPPLGPDDSVAVALPDALVATYLLTIPFADPKRIERVLPAEVEGAIPFDLADVVWDWTILGQAGGKSEVLIGVVQKKVLRDHLDVLAASGLDPRVVTLAPLALAALGERGVLVPDGAPPLTAALLEAGPDRADLALLDAGRPILARAMATANAQSWPAAFGGGRQSPRGGRAARGRNAAAGRADRASCRRTRGRPRPRAGPPGAAAAWPHQLPQGRVRVHAGPLTGARPAAALRGRGGAPPRARAGARRGPPVLAAEPGRRL